MQHVVSVIVLAVSLALQPGVATTKTAPTGLGHANLRHPMSARLSRQPGVLVDVASNAGAQNNPPTSRWVELGRPHVAKRGDAIVLVQTITSTASKDRFWALVEVNRFGRSPPANFLLLNFYRYANFTAPLPSASV